MNHAEALEMVASEFLKRVESDRKYRQENPTVVKALSAPEPALVIDAVVLPHVILSIVASNHETSTPNPELLSRDIKAAVSNEDMKRIAGICKKILAHARELHTEIMASDNREKYEAIRQEMINPKEGVPTGWSRPKKAAKSPLQKILAFLGFGK